MRSEAVESRPELILEPLRCLQEVSRHEHGVEILFTVRLYQPEHSHEVLAPKLDELVGIPSSHQCVELLPGGQDRFLIHPRKLQVLVVLVDLGSCFRIE